MRPFAKIIRSRVCVLCGERLTDGNECIRPGVGWIHVWCPFIDKQEAAA